MDPSPKRESHHILPPWRRTRDIGLENICLMANRYARVSGMGTTDTWDCCASPAAFARMGYASENMLPAMPAGKFSARTCLQ